MTRPRVVLYGASGNTGKLVAWKLASRGILFVAAGRDKARVDAALQKMPELAGADYEIAEVGHTVEELTELFRGRTVVYNTVGPFMQLAEPVVEACLRAGVHYLDASGEQDWILHVKDTYGSRFAERDLLVVPACSMMWTSGLLAAEACLEVPGIDALDIVYAPRGAPSVASTQSFVRMCCQPQRYLDDRELVLWPPAASYQVTVPGIHQLLTALPWSGGGEPVWFADDPRVVHCQTLVSFTNQQMMNWVADRMKEFEEKYKHLPSAEQEAATNAWANSLTPGEPPRDRLEANRTIVSCQARGNRRSVSAVLWGTNGYDQTGALAAAAVDRILKGKVKAAGFASPAAAFGARNLLRDWSEEGLVELELRT